MKELVTQWGQGTRMLRSSGQSWIPVNVSRGFELQLSCIGLLENCLKISILISLSNLARRNFELN